MENDPFQNIGEKTLEKLHKAFGSREEILRHAGEYRIDDFAGIDGISRKRAITIIKTLLGTGETSFLGSEKAEKMYHHVLELIKGYASTDYGRNRVELLVPFHTHEEMEKQMAEVMGYRELVDQYDIETIRKLLRKLHHYKEGKRGFSSLRVIIAENDAIYSELMKENLGNFIRIGTPGEIDNRQLAENYELILYVYEHGVLDFGDLDNVVELPSGTPVSRLVPGQTISEFRQNMDTLLVVSQLHKAISRPTATDEVLALLEKLYSETASKVNVRERAEELLTEMNANIEEELIRLELKGKEVIETLSQQMPERIRTIIQRHVGEARAKLKEETGKDCSPFKLTFPVELDEEELSRVERALSSDLAIKRYNAEVELARHLLELKGAIINEVRELFELDYTLSLGLFVRNYQLHPFSCADHLEITNGLHLDLITSHLPQKNEQAGATSLQRITYRLGKETNTAILTGANSGGKTTLLEMVAQHLILSKLGLPVPSENSTLPLIDELILYSPEKVLDAGAFESFLLSMLPILIAQDRRRFILMDEIEAITELEAASKIIGTFIDYLKSSNSLTIIVTHMAQEVLKNIDVRVDGIEATGLDENCTLIIDRSPKLGYFAKSTPELIIQRLASTTTGKEKEIFDAILKKFDESGMKYT